MARTEEYLKEIHHNLASLQTRSVDVESGQKVLTVSEKAKTLAEMKQQLLSMQSEFERFINDVNGMRSLLQPSANESKEMTSLIDDVKASPLDNLLLPSARDTFLKTLPNSSNGVPWDESIHSLEERVHKLLGDGIDTFTARGIVDDVKSRRLALEQQILSKSSPIKETNGPALRFNSESITFDMNSFIDEKTIDRDVAAYIRTGNSIRNKSRKKYSTTAKSDSKISSSEDPPNLQSNKREDIKRSSSPLRKALPRFYNVRVSDGPVFLRRTNVRPLNLEFRNRPSRTPSPVRQPFMQSQRVVAPSVSRVSRSPVNQKLVENETCDEAVQTMPQAVEQKTAISNLEVVEELKSKETQTIPSEWLQNALLKKLSLRRLKTVADCSSSTSDLRPVVLDLSCHVTTLFTEVIEQFLRLIAAGLICSREISQTFSSELFDEILKTVIDEIIFDIAFNLLYLNSEVQNLSIQLIDDCLAIELLDIFDECLRYETPITEPVGITVHTADVAIQVEKSRPCSPIAESAAEESSIESTIVSTLLSDGELFSDFASDGEFFLPVDRSIIQRTVSVKHLTEVPAGLHASAMRILGQVQESRNRAFSDGELSGIVSPGEISTLAPASKDLLNGNDDRARKVLAEIGMWSRQTNKDKEDDMTSLPDISTDISQQL